MWPLAEAKVSAAPESKPKLKVLIKSSWGSADPTQAAFPFHHARALAEAGHSVQIFLLGEAVTLMRSIVASNVTPVGWGPVSEAQAKVIDLKIPIYACGACSKARGVVDADLAGKGASFGNPTIFVGLVEWADRVLTE
jgi:predicted peroxiredoxin